jgi:PPOX class probable FMN-dependent enzyme
MTETDPHSIKTVEELRSLVGDVPAGFDLKVVDRLGRFERDFLERCPFLIIASASENGHLDASPKGDGPGFVVVEDDQSLVIPDRPGNKLVFGHLNILRNPHVGLLFMIPGTPETLRVNGRAELTRDPALLERLAARGRPAILATRVRIDECFFHCAKAFMRSNLWKPEKWGDRHRVSFGEIYAAGNTDAASAIDKAIEEDYRDNL